MNSSRFVVTALLLVGLVGSSACESIKSRFARQALPDLGAPVPLTAALEFDPSLTKAEAEYLDGCGMFRVLSVGPVLEDTLVQAAHQTFSAVNIQGGHTVSSKPDVTVRLRLLEPRLKMNPDALYDRVPTNFSLDAFAVFVDSAGNVIAERPLQAIRKERVQLSLEQRRCDYILDPLVQDASVLLATQFMQEARVLFDKNKPAGEQPSTQGAAPVGQPSPKTAEATTPVPSLSGSSPLSFKATLLDENGNSVLEAGERIRIRVDVANTGQQSMQGAVVALTAPPALLAQFPASQLALGQMDPGGTKSVEFVATLPQSLPSQQAEFQVSLQTATGATLSKGQTLLASAQSVGTSAEDVDRVPTATPGFQQPQHFLVSIGLGSYRETNIPARKFAGLDAEMIAAYFQSLGGLPASNVRMLQDWKALRPDIEELLLDWLPGKVTEQSLVVIYFAGQAVVSPAGETFLIPYDGNLGSTSRLYPLKDLDAALARLKTKSVLFIFDGTVLKAGSTGTVKQGTVAWGASAGSVARLIGTTGYAKNLESDKLRHGLYTYYLLRALRGEADANRNGEVTVGELTAYVNQKVPAAAKSGFNQEQRPQVLAPARGSEKLNDLILTKPSAVDHP
ncbi:MAG: hypothetical protein KF814_04460 [Nitrospiraceae bacterium]|nr:hypothetical protein [Nitrospiraceae bacterium]